MKALPECPICSKPILKLADGTLFPKNKENKNKAISIDYYDLVHESCINEPQEDGIYFWGVKI